MHMTQKNRHLLPILLTLSLFLVYPGFALGKEAVLQVVAGGVMQEQDTGRMWQMERSKKLKSSMEVKQYISDLNQGQFKDWRLPTQWELYDLFAIFDLKKNGRITIPLEGNYWLVDNHGAMRPGTWETGDQCGPERIFYPGKTGYVRAVRP